MKLKIAGIGLMVAAALAFTACEDETNYSASFDRFELDEVTATPGDESVTLLWTPQEGKPSPVSYYITWSASGASDSAGETEVDGNTTSATIQGLTNDLMYNFAVQSRYPSGLARRITTSATPKTTRIPVSGFKAMAGDKRAFLSWTAPETGLSHSYEIEVSSTDAVSKTLTAAQGAESMLINDLVNDTEYEFAITVIYSHGKSETLRSSATPGQISPIAVSPENPHPYELCKLEYNPAYFVAGTIASVEWSVDGKAISTAETATHLFATPGSNIVTITVTYTDGSSETGSITVDVQEFAWSEMAGAGYQKASNFAFSPDGQTLYSISQSTKTLLAINAITGEIRWQQTLAAATYGAGIAVGPDGKVYLGTEDGAGTLYAFTPNGTVKWQASMGKAVKAAPAVTSDGVVYALCDGAKLIAYDAADGAHKWTADLSGNAGGVAVDAAGNIYAGTSSGIWAYSPAGTRLWQSADAHKVTERGGSLAIDSSRGVIFATLKGKGGVAAVDMASGATKWTYASEYNDCYHPVVDAQGTVYFNEKNGALYAVTYAGTLKWKYSAGLGYTYSGFAIGADSHAYITQYASPFAVLDIAPDGSATVLTNIAQTMSPVCIGPDARLYYGLNGSIATFNIGILPATEGWPCRGGNIHGTNSLK
ncbi:PQQ-binding-like beta-propeller repeat protein [uncultured Muribaculum sp.]|uniref:outer membrane protein assembly factor BamB family protein n=1 Tax=uncultured Muribaculum sp. TaxID=1918613 RepID=UPI0025EB49EC|nr:PQQ-binding-like beta-propeller repeat protein [uncultured Muribaculum sp.]